MRALDEIGARRGLGELLAEGTRRAAERVGGGSAAFAPHVKGLELPGYEPRTMQAMALGLAVNSRGADHNRSGAYEADLSGDHDRLAGGRRAVAAAVETEDRAAVMDSLILCKFLRGVFTEPFDEWAALLSAVTGWDTDGAELRQTARRIVLAKRVFNIREGWRPQDDWLPERLLSEPLPVGVRPGRDADAGAAARHDRRLLRRPRAGRRGPPGGGGLADLPAWLTSSSGPLQREVQRDREHEVEQPEPGAQVEEAEQPLGGPYRAAAGLARRLRRRSRRTYMQGQADEEAADRVDRPP